MPDLETLKWMAGPGGVAGLSLFMLWKVWGLYVSQAEKTTAMLVDQITANHKTAAALDAIRAAITGKTGA